MAKAPLSPTQARIYPEFPSLVDYTTDLLFPEVWERPGLSKRDRSLITLAALLATHRPVQLKVHVRRALANGVTKEEISELVTHLAFYAGWPAAMVAAFEAAPAEHLAERLLRGLEAGLAAGGEEGPVKSAGVLVVHEQEWPLVELREDWREEDVIPALRTAWQVYAPQIDDYMTRALDPDAAPSYGVPGDL